VELIVRFDSLIRHDGVTLASPLPLDTVNAAKHVISFALVVAFWRVGFPLDVHCAPVYVRDRNLIRSEIADCTSAFALKTVAGRRARYAYESGKNSCSEKHTFGVLHVISLHFYGDVRTVYLHPFVRNHQQWCF
jgi:hypothetical protein